MEDYSKKRNKPSTQRGYQAVIDRCIVPLIGRKKVPDVKRPDIAGLMEKVAYPISCDHIPRRSWALLQAREVMLGVLESFRQEQNT